MDDRQEIEEIKKNLWGFAQRFETLSSMIADLTNRVTELENQDVE